MGSAGPFFVRSTLLMYVCLAGLAAVHANVVELAGRKDGKHLAIPHGTNRSPDAIRRRPASKPAGAARSQENRSSPITPSPTLATLIFDLRDGFFELDYLAHSAAKWLYLFCNVAEGFPDFRNLVSPRRGFPLCS